MLAGETEIEVVASCGDLPSLLAAVEAESPDVVLTDIRMPPTSTDEGIRAGRRAARDAPRDRRRRAQPVRRAGVRAGPARARARRVGPTCSRSGSTTAAQLVAAIETVAAGGSVIDPKVVEVAGRGPRRAASSSPLAHLTPREREVLAEIAQGKSNARDRRVAGAHRAGRREAHQLDLPEARALERRGRQQAGQGDPALPRRRRRSGHRCPRARVIR